MKSRVSSALCLLLTAVPLIAQIDNPTIGAGFTGTWFGSFNVSTPVPTQELS